MRRVLPAILSLLMSAVPAKAQHPPRVELEAGGGYVFGGGVENPGPSLPALDGGAAFWWSDRWGLALRAVVGPGEDLIEASPGIDRTFLGTGHLRYLAVTVRRRRPMTNSWGLELGGGMMLFGQFAMVQMLRDPPRRVVGVDSSFSGFAVEALATRAIARHLALKAGLTFDFNFETNNLQPLVLAAIRF